MENTDTRIVLTGFMGVGKSTVARHLSRLTRQRRVDLDDEIERCSGRSIPEIVREDGIEVFRTLEFECLEKVINDGSAKIISLGGGAWISSRNRKIIRDAEITSVWLETTFEHCWRNIKASRKKRPLINGREEARKMFKEREKVYCLADWHFVVDRGYNSFDIAQRIAADVLQARIQSKEKA